MFKLFKTTKKALKRIDAIHNSVVNPLSKNSQIAQRQLFCQIQTMKAQDCLPKFDSVGFREFSQFDEDGIILYIFAIIGFTNKYCLDIAFADPHGANTTNLILNWGFGGTLICADGTEKNKAENFFKANWNTWLVPPKLTNSWVTTENIGETLLKNSVPKDIDFFSLDMDGVDYWILKSALETISPRVIVVESQNIWKDEKSVSAKYSADFDRHKIHEDYFGASIPAFIKLMKQHDYRLVAHNKYGFNLFFVKNELCENYLQELTATDCIKNLPDYYIEELDKRKENIKDLDWVEV